MLINVELLAAKITVEDICNNLTLLFQIYYSNNRKENKYSNSCFVDVTLKCYHNLWKIPHNFGFYLFIRIVFHLKLTKLKIDYVEFSTYAAHQQRASTQFYTGSRDIDKNDLTSTFIFSNISKYFIKNKIIFNLQCNKNRTVKLSFFIKIK